MLPASRFVALDVETTGFRSSARVVEIGCALFEHGEPIHRWSSLVRPVGVNWEDEDVKEAMGVNKISREEVEKAPTFAEVFHNLFIYLRAARVWVAHNAQFDLRMLGKEFQLYKGSKFPIAPQEGVLCTLALSRAIHPQVRGHSLEAVAGRWGVELDALHRASSDALACGRILSAMSRTELPANIGWVHDQGRQSDGGG